MGMLALFPWLKLREPLRAGPFHLVPYSPRHGLPAEVPCSVSPEDMSRVVSPYRASVQHRLANLAVLQYDGRAIGAEFSPADREALFRFARYFAVAGISTRRYDGNVLGSYSATGHYQLIVQGFPEPFTGSISVTHPRKDGSTTILIGASDHVFLMPEYLVNQYQLELDHSLLEALMATKGKLSDEDQGCVEAAINQFLLANTDAPDSPWDVECVSTYAALERLVDAGHRWPDLKKKLTPVLQIVERAPWRERLVSEFEFTLDPERNSFQEWLKHLHNLRGNAGHGYPFGKMRQSRWTQQEMLMAGALLFPLALKCWLAGKEIYQLTVDDTAKVMAFDALLGTEPYFGKPGRPGDPFRDPRESSAWLKCLGDIEMAVASFELSQTIGDVMVNQTAKGNFDGSEEASAEPADDRSSLV